MVNFTSAPARPVAQRPASIVAISAIVILGAALRFWDLGLARHGHDDAYPAYDALRMLEGHRVLLVGQPSSVFLDNPPLMSYIQLGPLLLWRSPWAAYLLIVALNTVAIWFVYGAARDMLSEPVGLLAAFLVAINPWVVFFSRTTWVQSLMPFFMAVMAWGLWPCLATGRRYPGRVMAAGLGMVAMVQCYVQSWGVLGQVVPLVVAFWRSIPRRALCLTLAVLALSLALYAAGLAGGLKESRYDLARFAGSGPYRLTREGLDHALRLVTGRDYEYVHAGEGTAGYARLRQASLVVSLLLQLALFAGVARALDGLRRPGVARRRGAVLLIWFLVPILLMSVSAHPVHPHYLLLSFPAGHALAALGVAPLLQRVWPRRATIAVLLAIAGLFGYSLMDANSQVAAHPAGSQLAEWPLAASAQVGDVIRKAAGARRRPLRVVSDTSAALLSSISGVYVETLQYLRYPDYVVLPGQEPLLYVLVDREPVPGALGPRELVLPEPDLDLADGTRATLVLVPPYDRSDALALPEVVADWPSEAGLSLLGYTMDKSAQPGQAIHCTTYWRVDELRPGREGWYIGLAYHLFDPSGQKIVNVSKHGQWGHRWRLGDVYVERMSIALAADLAPGEYRLVLTLFDPIHRRAFPLEKPDGPGSLSVSITIADSACAACGYR